LVDVAVVIGDCRASPHLGVRNDRCGCEGGFAQKHEP